MRSFRLLRRFEVLTFGYVIYDFGLLFIRVLFGIFGLLLTAAEVSASTLLILGATRAHNFDLLERGGEAAGVATRCCPSSWRLLAPFLRKCGAFWQRGIDYQRLRLVRQRRSLSVRSRW